MLVVKHGNVDHIKQLLDKGVEKADFADGPGSNSHRILTISLQRPATRKPDASMARALQGSGIREAVQSHCSKDVSGRAYSVNVQLSASFAKVAEGTGTCQELIPRSEPKAARL